ncbi:transposase [Microbacterium sp.]|uniref:transposase n=1 Tax=Microbacterium sp. TaxID=51671 RepID=UPI003C7831A4
MREDTRRAGHRHQFTEKPVLRIGLVGDDNGELVVHLAPELERYGAGECVVRVRGGEQTTDRRLPQIRLMLRDARHLAAVGRHDGGGALVDDAPGDLHVRGEHDGIPGAAHLQERSPDHTEVELQRDCEQVAERVAAAEQAAVVKPKAQRNFTDPQSRIMKTSDGSFHQCYNGQAMVDEDHQVIVAASVTDNASDVGNLIPMTEQTVTNTDRAPKQVTADAGYCSDDNLAQAAEVTAATGTEFFIATGRHKHDALIPDSPRGRIPAGATRRERMARKLRTNKGRTAYARRKVIVEPVFGQMSTLQNGKHLLLRGLEGARGEWLLLAACHNLRKLHGKIGIDGLGSLATR